jgi:sigma-B regulation protein RsbU (phosphoserine phosphatase)
MKILIAEDDPVSRRLLEATLERFGYEVAVATDGAEAWTALQRDDAPPLAILDWMMPELDGVEICRRVREIPTSTPPYLILLTAKTERGDVVAGLDAGANDYLKKPFDRGELRARLQVGAQVLELQKNLAERISELEDALAQVNQLRGLLPICSYCKNIRDEQNFWQRVDSYLMEHADVMFSHGICPDCYKNIVEPKLEQSRADR